jgi:hypothetical protein
LGLLSAANPQVINYPNGFTSANLGNNPGQIYPNNASYLSGTSIQIGDATGHRANNAWYTTPVNVQAFTTTFTFHVNCSANPSDCGDGLGFMMIAADSSNPAYNPPSDNGFTYSGFSGGQFSWSQCNSPFELGNGCPALPAMLVKFDLYNNVTDAAGANETGLYTGGGYPQAPENPQYDMSGSGINMESGDEFKATLVYNGTTLVETLTDTVTKAQYTQTYAGVNLPSVISANTSLVGFGAGSGAAELLVYIDSWTYTVESVASPPPPTTVSAPTFSPAAGAYTSAQSVIISDATSDATIYYTTNGTVPTTSSNRYTGPITVSSSETMEAIAVTTADTSSAVASAAYILSSIGVGSPMTCTPLQAVSGQRGTLQTACTITLNP